MMESEIPRRNISELQTLYSLEPSLRDLFVEGEYDKVFINSLYKNNPSQLRVIYSIDSINVPDESLKAVNLTRGNKQEVIALIFALGTISTISYKGLVDKDLDQWTGNLLTIPNLIHTEYVCLESYFVTSNIIYDLLVTYAEAKIADWGSFYQSFTYSLSLIYSIRLCLNLREWNIKLVPYDKSLSMDKGIVRFDLDGYLSRLLISNGLKGESESAVKQITKLHNDLSGDPRYYIHGHDLIEVLGWCTRKFSGSRPIASNPELFQKAMILISDNFNNILDGLN